MTKQTKPTLLFYRFIIKVLENKESAQDITASYITDQFNDSELNLKTSEKSTLYALNRLYAEGLVNKEKKSSTGNLCWTLADDFFAFLQTNYLEILISELRKNFCNDKRDSEKETKDDSHTLTGKAFIINKLPSLRLSKHLYFISEPPEKNRHNIYFPYNNSTYIKNKILAEKYKKSLEKLYKFFHKISNKARESYSNESHGNFFGIHTKNKKTTLRHFSEQKIKLNEKESCELFSIIFDITHALVSASKDSIHVRKEYREHEFILGTLNDIILQKGIKELLIEKFQEKGQDVSDNFIVKNIGNDKETNLDSMLRTGIIHDSQYSFLDLHDSTMSSIIKLTIATLMSADLKLNHENGWEEIYISTSSPRLLLGNLKHYYKWTLETYKVISNDYIYPDLKISKDKKLEDDASSLLSMLLFEKILLPLEKFDNNDIKNTADLIEKDFKTCKNYLDTLTNIKSISESGANGNKIYYCKKIENEKYRELTEEILNSSKLSHYADYQFIMDRAFENYFCFINQKSDKNYLRLEFLIPPKLPSYITKPSFKNSQVRLDNFENFLGKHLVEEIDFLRFLKNKTISVKNTIKDDIAELTDTYDSMGLEPSITFPVDQAYRKLLDGGCLYILPISEIEYCQGAYLLQKHFWGNDEEN